MKTAGINKRNGKGESPLHLAVRRGDLSLMKVLIESGADVNLKDNAGLDSFNCIYNLNSHFTAPNPSFESDYYVIANFEQFSLMTYKLNSRTYLGSHQLLK